MSKKDETQPNKRVKKPTEGDWDQRDDPNSSDRPFGRPARDSELTEPRPLYTECAHVCWWPGCENSCTKMRSHFVHVCDQHRIFPHPDDIY